MKYQVQENCLTIYLPREVDHHNAEEMKREADAVIDRNHIKYVIFDFERTDFMDSSGIVVILGREKTVGLMGGGGWGGGSGRLDRTAGSSGWIGRHHETGEEVIREEPSDMKKPPATIRCRRFS